MSDPVEIFTQFLKQLGQSTGAELPLDDNSCHLTDGTGDVVVIIELPEDSDILLFHRVLAQWPASENLRNARALQLLALNGEPDKMQGAWFCTDPEGSEIHLMTSCSIELINYEIFETLLLNFIDLGKTLSKELKHEEQDEMSTQTPPFGLQA